MSSPGYHHGHLLIPNTLQIRLRWTLPNGKFAHNVLHGIVDGGLDNSVLLANSIYDAIAGSGETTTYLDFLSSETSLDFVDIRDVRTENQTLYQSEGAALPGTGTGNALPEEVSLVVTLRSALAGPAHRGRVYLTGFDDSVLDVDGHCVSGCATAARNFVVAISGALLANGVALGIGHRGHDEYTNSAGNTVLAELPGTDLVTSILVRDNVFDSQRRRK